MQQSIHDSRYEYFCVVILSKQQPDYTSAYMTPVYSERETMCAAGTVNLEMIIVTFIAEVIYSFGQVFVFSFFSFSFFIVQERISAAVGGSHISRPNGIIVCPICGLRLAARKDVRLSVNMERT